MSKFELVPFEVLKGLTFDRVSQEMFDGNDSIDFETDCAIYHLTHEQDCCETVTIEDICGDLEDLVGTALLSVEETSNESTDGDEDSETWTFYHFRTIKGTVSLRWHGVSNGYYSESVELLKETK